MAFLGHGVHVIVGLQTGLATLPPPHLYLCLFCFVVFPLIFFFFFFFFFLMAMAGRGMFPNHWLHVLVCENKGN